jgi:cytochrome P450
MVRESRRRKVLLLTERISGDIISLRVFGRVIVVLNSVKASKDLLERRGDIYSDRAFVPICEMYVFFYVRTLGVGLMALRMKWEWIVPLARNTEFWRQARRLLDRGLRPGAVPAYRPLQQAKARALLVSLLAKPDEWEAHLDQFVVFLSA